MRASTCGQETTFDTRISIYRGEDCQELECVISDDNGCGFQSSAYWFSNKGETYYILVTGNLFSSFGDFALRIEDYRPNTINDFCANAISASTTTVNLGSTKNATFDGVETCVVSNTAPGKFELVRYALNCAFLLSCSTNPGCCLFSRAAGIWYTVSRTIKSVSMVPVFVSLSKLIVYF